MVFNWFYLCNFKFKLYKMFIILLGNVGYGFKCNILSFPKSFTNNILNLNVFLMIKQYIKIMQYCKGSVNIVLNISIFCIFRCIICIILQSVEINGDCMCIPGSCLVCELNNYFNKQRKPLIKLQINTIEMIH